MGTVYNAIPGLLPVEVFLENGEKEYRYDVTGCSSLKGITQIDKLSGEDLKSLFLSISQLVSEIRRYLLREEGLLLEPELIWRSNVTGEWYYCFHAGTATDLREQIRALSLWAINRIDVSDAGAVYAGYGIYLLSLEDNTGLADIEEIFLRPEYLETERKIIDPLAGERELSLSGVSGMKELTPTADGEHEEDVSGNNFEEENNDESDMVQTSAWRFPHCIRRFLGEALVLFLIVGVLIYMIP